MAISKTSSRGLYTTISTYIPNPLKNKTLRVALPIFGLAAVLLCVLYLRHRTLTTRKTRTLAPLNPEGFIRLILQAPPASDRKQYFRDENPSNRDTAVKVGSQTYAANWIRFTQLSYGFGTSLDYIVAENPPIANCMELFYNIINNEAGVVISFEDSPFFGCPDRSMFTKFGLKVEESTQLTSNCRAQRLEVTRNQKQETIWHLIFSNFKPSAPFQEIQAHVDAVNAFIQEKGIQLQGLPIIVSCPNGILRSGLFILFHQLDHHLSLLIDKSLQEHPSSNNDQIANAILMDTNIQTMLMCRARIIESQSTQASKGQELFSSMSDNFTGKGKVTPDEINQAYRAHVIAKIQNMRTNT